MRNIILLMYFLFLSCKKHEQDSIESNVKFTFEKVFIVNQFESDIAFFRINVANDSDVEFAFLDNMSREHGPDNMGFYLESKNDTIKLILQNDRYFGVANKSSRKYYFYTHNLDYTLPKDSLTLKQYLSEFKIRYNGKPLDTIKVENAEKLKITKDTFSIDIDNKVEVLYYDEIPVYKNIWNKT